MPLTIGPNDLVSAITLKIYVKFHAQVIRKCSRFSGDITSTVAYSTNISIVTFWFINMLNKI